MSGDFFQPLDSSRPEEGRVSLSEEGYASRSDEGYASQPEEGYLAGAGGPSPVSAGNPLVKGFIILTMVAVATTVLLATRDGDDSTVVAASDIESAPLGPAADDDADGVGDDSTASSSTSEPDGSEAGSESADSWITPRPAQLSSFSAADRLRQQGSSDGTSSTEAPTTTDPPATSAPSTTAETTVPESSDADAGSEASASSTETGSTETTDAAGTTSSSDGAADGTETTEASTTTTTAGTDSTTGETTTTAEDGWVDSGNGVMLPPVLLAIRYCESRDNYQAANPSSSARGAYQFLTSSWAAYGHAERYGVSRADLASNAQQDEAALITWERDGTRPWNASKSCWSQRI